MNIRLRNEKPLSSSTSSLYKSHFLNTILELGTLLVAVGVGSVVTNELGLLEHVPLVLLRVEVTEAEPEGHATDKGNTGDGGVVPDQERIARQRSESLADGSRDGGHEEVDGHDERLHVLRGLGEGVFVRGDVGEDLGNTDEDVGERLGPDVDGGRVAFLTSLELGVNPLATGVHLVDVVLHDCGGNHGHGSNEEAGRHALDGSESETDLAEGGVQDVVDDWDHDDDGNGVEVLDDIVGDTVTGHGGGLNRKVTGHLVVGQEEDGQEEEDLAGHQTTANLVDPGVVVGHPRRTLSDGNVRGLGGLPVGLPEAALLLGEAEHAEELGEDGASGGRQLVLLLLRPEDEGGDEEETGGDEESLPETVEVLNPDHTDLSREGADVDAQVEVQEDTGVGDGGVDDDTLALAHLDTHAGVLVLLSKQGRDVGLEETSADAKSDETDDEGSEASVTLDDDTGSGGGDKDNVGNGGDTNGQVKSPETTHAGIRNPGTEQRHNVGEELVEQADALGSTGTHSQGTGLAAQVGGGTSRRPLRKRVVDEVGVEDGRAVVGETLAKLDKGDGPHGPHDLSRDTAQGAHLLLGGLVGVVIVVGGRDDIVAQSFLASVDRAPGRNGGGVLSVG